VPCRAQPYLFANSPCIYICQVGFHATARFVSFAVDVQGYGLDSGSCLASTRASFPSLASRVALELGKTAYLSCSR
jgi:hypothetical protein